MSAHKKKKRAGKNPTKTEIQLRGMLVAAQNALEDLKKTNEILSGEASAVLEALWNGHQEMTLIVTDVVKRINVIEDTIGIEREKDDEQEEGKGTEAPGDGTDDLSESEPGGEGTVHSGQEGEEPTEVPSAEGDGRPEEPTKGEGV